MWKRPIEALIRKVDQMKGSPIVGGRGKPRKTIGERMTLMSMVYL